MGILGLSNILLTLGFVKIAKDDYSPIFCASLFSLIVFLFRYIILFPNGVYVSFKAAIILFPLSFIYFWGLKKTQYYPVFWWTIIGLGFLMGLI